MVHLHIYIYAYIITGIIIIRLTKTFTECLLFAGNSAKCYIYIISFDPYFIR